MPLLLKRLFTTSLRKKGKSIYILLKINFKKAYILESIRSSYVPPWLNLAVPTSQWSYLELNILTSCHLPSPQVNDLILNCTTSTNLSLKWNNERLHSFVPHRGLYILRWFNVVLLFQVMHGKANPSHIEEV